MLRIELGVELVVDLALRHPERSLHLRARVAHDELAGRDEGHLHLHAATQVHGLRWNRPGDEWPTRTGDGRRRRCSGCGWRRIAQSYLKCWQSLKVGFEAGTGGIKLLTSFQYGARADLFQPGAKARHVEINPRDQAVPGLAVQPDAMMALLKHLHQLTDVGVILHRIQDVIVAFRAGAVYEGVQVPVGRTEAAAAA